MPRIKTHTTGLYTRVSPKLIERLDALALSKGMSRSECHRFLIQTAIEKEEDRQQK